MINLTKKQATEEIKKLGLNIYEWMYCRQSNKYVVSICTGPSSTRTFEAKSKSQLLKNIKLWVSG